MHVFSCCLVLISYEHQKSVHCSSNCTCSVHKKARLDLDTVWFCITNSSPVCSHGAACAVCECRTVHRRQVGKTITSVSSVPLTKPLFQTFKGPTIPTSPPPNRQRIQTRKIHTHRGLSYDIIITSTVCACDIILLRDVDTEWSGGRTLLSGYQGVAVLSLLTKHYWQPSLDDIDVSLVAWVMLTSWGTWDLSE
jgi:hypothetical protein